MKVTIEKIDVKHDERGSVFEPLTQKEISEQTVTTDKARKGTAR